jgi:hypothetical protein
MQIALVGIMVDVDNDAAVVPNDAATDDPAE